MSRIAMIVTLVAGLLAGCGGKGDETPPTTASGSAPAGSGSGKAAGSNTGSAAGSGSAAAAATDPEVPTEEDFEEESNTRITEKNVDTEVKALEKEIGE